MRNHLMPMPRQKVGTALQRPTHPVRRTPQPPNHGAPVGPPPTTKASRHAKRPDVPIRSENDGPEIVTETQPTPSAERQTSPSNGPGSLNPPPPSKGSPHAKPPDEDTVPNPRKPAPPPNRSHPPTATHRPVAPKHPKAPAIRNHLMIKPPRQPRPGNRHPAPSSPHPPTATHHPDNPRNSHCRRRHTAARHKTASPPPAPSP